MAASEKLKGIRDWANTYRDLFTVVGVILAATSLFGPWVLAKLASFITFAPTVLNIAKQYSDMGVWCGIALIITGLFVRTRTLNGRLNILERQTTILLDKSQSADLANWDYRGQWSLDGEELVVTNSDDGGLLKWGAAWENYDLIFRFKIVNECAGWIVRAESHHRFVMIQCNQSRLLPHTRGLEFRLPSQPDPERGFRVVRDFAHGLSLGEWNTVKTEVRGYSIRVFINGREIFSDPELLSSLPLGRVGFRCYGGEHARFKDIEVIQKDGCSIY